MTRKLTTCQNMTLQNSQRKKKKPNVRYILKHYPSNKTNKQNNKIIIRIKLVCSAEILLKEV